MRVWSAIICVTVLFAACGSNKIPADILPVNRMQTIVWQLMQSDEYITLLLAKDSTKKSSTERMRIYKEVFDLNKTSMAEFKKSYRFYTEHPDITKGMFDSIIVRAGRQRIQLLQPKADSLAHKADSIRRIKIDSAGRVRADSLHHRRVPGMLPRSNAPLLPDTTATKKGAPPKKKVKKKIITAPVK